jgi:hypothetical protein
MEELSHVSACQGVGHGVASGRIGAAGSLGTSGTRIVVFIEVHPHRTVSWRLSRDAELRVVDASVWLTRHQDPYDYWLKAGDVVRLPRGERVWLSTESEHAVEVSLTSYRRGAHGFVSRWLAKVWPRIGTRQMNAL